MHPEVIIHILIAQILLDIKTRMLEVVYLNQLLIIMTIIIIPIYGSVNLNSYYRRIIKTSG